MHPNIKIMSDEESVSLVVTGGNSADLQSVQNRIEQIMEILSNVLESDLLVEKLPQEEFEARVIGWVSADLRYQAALSEALSRSASGLRLLREEVSSGSQFGSETLDDT
ncbi:hypothetical protein [Parasedimentitalea maritima]|uniref:hypothetical protein n=1 Tax=Parasedimentitalea maritima TaxID=2578117 RepID=UPI0010FED6C5|nr:hypothetical protein [Zongyanglinia marina]